MKTLAAILVETGKDLVIDEIDVPKLAPGQVLVEVHYSGVCHTQLSECKGHRGQDTFLPHCLGHEGSGVVVETGSAVQKVSEGDRVILSWIKGSGANVSGAQYGWGSRQVNAGGITTFSHHAVISENRLTKIQNDLSMRDAALVGCAIATGAGSVFNTAGARPGQSIVIFGVGGIGLSAVAAPAVTGCSPIIAVDPAPQRLRLAKALGATHCIDPTQCDPVEAVREICPGGVDIAIEASGLPSVMEQALSSVRSQGGVAVVVGNARHGQQLKFDPHQLNQGKQLRGTWGGDNQPDRDFPRYCKLVACGKLNLNPILSEPFDLVQINEALAALEQGVVGRPIVAMPAANSQAKAA